MRRNYLYDPASQGAHKISRSKIDLFVKCPRCFYLDQRLGVKIPPGYPFNINSAVDFLLKKEFDIHRAKGTAHPLMQEYKVNAIPFAHENIDKWRENFVGVQYLHEPSNLLITGAVDDLWARPNGEVIVVDYKATAKDSEVNIDAEWQDGYKRQMEIYQWLMRRNGFNVSETGYFVYCNGRRDKAAFDGRIEFDIKLIPYEGDDSWVEPKILEIKKTLDEESIPEQSPDCEYCNYTKARENIEC
ncbi:MAG: PD-(D/E)XK nuclease family protein [Patescibacteria group bacterium]